MVSVNECLRAPGVGTAERTPQPRFGKREDPGDKVVDFKLWTTFPHPTHSSFQGANDFKNGGDVTTYTLG